MMLVAAVLREPQCDDTWTVRRCGSQRSKESSLASSLGCEPTSDSRRWPRLVLRTSRHSSLCHQCSQSSLLGQVMCSRGINSLVAAGIKGGAVAAGRQPASKRPRAGMSLVVAAPALGAVEPQLMLLVVTPTTPTRKRAVASASKTCATQRRTSYSGSLSKPRVVIAFMQFAMQRRWRAASKTLGAPYAGVIRLAHPRGSYDECMHVRISVALTRFSIVLRTRGSKQKRRACVHALPSRESNGDELAPS